MEPRSAVFPAWVHSHTGVDRRLGPRRISLFMTLPPYTQAREGEVHELGLGGRNCSRRARSRPVEASSERMEREGPATSAQRTARCASRGKCNDKWCTVVQSNVLCESANDEPEERTMKMPKTV